jgi:flagellar motor protein MotB
MAAKGGGSWKVAYADFVTAMMAFFLVMWICSQDQKLKEAVAYYFQHPTSLENWGQSKKPMESGALFDLRNKGTLPDSESVHMGRGRVAYIKGESSPATKLVSDWLHTDPQAYQHWRKRASDERELAQNSKDVRNHLVKAEDAARTHLAEVLEAEIARDLFGRSQGLNKELLRVAFSEVNWLELAEDLLSSLD